MRSEAPGLQQMMGKCQRQANVPATSSDKGGVRKSNITARLSNGLSAQPNSKSFLRKSLTGSAKVIS